MSIAKLKLMLSQAALLKKNYEQIAYLTGRNFNIFDVLGLSKKEVRTHSAFLAELLNPEGSHGQRDKYLSLFVDRLSLDSFEFKSEDATVYCEKHIGRLSDDGSSGGRIDLLIEDKNKQRIIIENKIYAADQPNQLLRCYKRYPEAKAKLFYLTLEGDGPSAVSLGGESFPFKKISYAKDIIPWLELCIKESASLPVIRETLHQYINLIKNLTGQTMMTEKSSEIQKLILGKKRLELLRECQDAVNGLYKDVRNRFEKAFAQEYDYYKKDRYLDFSKNGADLKVQIGEDYYGVFIGYKWFSDEGTDNSTFNIDVSTDYISKLKDELESKLKDKLDIKIHGPEKNYFVWFNPAPFKGYERVKKLSDEKIYKAYKNDEYLKDLVKITLQLQKNSEEMCFSQ